MRKQKQEENARKKEEAKKQREEAKKQREEAKKQREEAKKQKEEAKKLKEMSRQGNQACGLTPTQAQSSSEPRSQPTSPRAKRQRICTIATDACGLCSNKYGPNSAWVECCTCGRRFEEVCAGVVAADLGEDAWCCPICNCI